MTARRVGPELGLDEDALALVHRIDNRREVIVLTIAHLGDEAARLEALRDSLVAFAQPADAGDGEEGARASSPTEKAGRANGRARKAEPEAGGRPPAAVPPAPPAPPAPTSCARCDFVSRTSQGLGVHVARIHRGAKESFLCGRNCGASFPSKMALARHESKEACQPVQGRPPSGQKPLSLGGSSRNGAGHIAGLGE